MWSPCSVAAAAAGIGGGRMARRGEVNHVSARECSAWTRCSGGCGRAERVDAWMRGCSRAAVAVAVTLSRFTTHHSTGTLTRYVVPRRVSKGEAKRARASLWPAALSKQLQLQLQLRHLLGRCRREVGAQNALKNEVARWS